MDDKPDKMLVKVETESGEVTLSPAIVRRYLVNGNGSVTDQEVTMFLALCKFQRLNPFLREAYLLKFGTEQATIVTGKEAFLKRAMKVADLEGFRAGVAVSKDDEFDYTAGLVPTGWKLCGGWAEVHKKGWAFPLRVEVSFDEYVGKKKDGTVNRMWTEKPGTMIRKVALVQALREAFPVDLAGMYSPEEISTIPYELPHAPVDVGQVSDIDVNKTPDFDPIRVPGDPDPEKPKRIRRTQAQIKADEEAKLSALHAYRAGIEEQSDPPLTRDPDPLLRHTGNCPVDGDGRFSDICPDQNCPGDPETCALQQSSRAGEI